MSSQQLLQKVYPLTPMQEGILYHSLLDPNDQSFFVQLSFGIKGDLQKSLLEQSLQLLIMRHDVFRTVFNTEKAKQPIQIVLEKRKSKISYTDLSFYSGQEQADLLASLKEQDRAKGFDLTRDLLIRLSVFKKGEADFHLLLSFHHIIVDGWSLGPIIEELFAIYQAMAENTDPRLPEPKPFSTYLQWLHQQNQQKAGSYWSDYIEGVDEPTLLPWAKKEKSSGYQQQKVQLAISKEETARLKRLAKEHHVTLNTVVQSIWSIILKRYNNADDVLFGAVVSGRQAPISGIEQMIGLFINTNPVRVRFEAGIRFTELMKRMQTQMLASEEHSYFPLSKIQAASELSQGLIHHIIAFENVPLEVDLLGGHDFQGLKLYDFDLFEQTNYDFNLIVIPTEELAITLKYNGLVYEQGHMEKVAGHIREVVKTILSDPSVEIGKLCILTDAEQNELSHHYNQTKMSYPKDKLLHQVFTESARRHPEKTALLFRDRSMTYRELHERSNQLARVLRREGIGPNQIVGLMVERSFEMMIAILAIHKAGGAYVPIDPANPAERIRFLLKDSEAKLLLTQSPFIQELDVEQIVMDLDDKALYQGDSSDLECINVSADLAYVIYTSGSTGMPKGVMIEHHAVINNMCWMQHQYPITENDVIMQKTAYTFDVSVFELCWWFFHGATLCFLEPGGEKEPEMIIQTVEQQGVTVIHFVPSMLQAFLDYLEYGDNHVKRLSTIQKVFASGEALSAQHVNRFNQLWRGNTSLILSNLYGPTEATIHVSYYDCPAGTEVSTVLIGKPVENIQLYIVDRDHQLQPLGVPGELCIAGAGLARGYVNRPELTEEVFVRNPFTPGAKMYKTGDLCRLLPDGNIEYMGRMDFQLKIRGFRIEMGEIEAHLFNYRSIRQALVTMNEDMRGGKYLCAYLIMSEPLDEEDLRAYLLARLPSYMVPSYYMQLDSYPLNQSGKIDRKSLPLPNIQEQGNTEYLAPRDEAEMNLVKVWQDVLGVTQLGIDDHFFALGGDSIKAIQVSSRLQKHGLQVGIKDLFDHPTVAQLAKVMKRSTKSCDQGVVTGDVELTPIQHWFFDQEIPHRGHWNQAFMLYRESGFEKEALEKALTHLFIHHDALRMVYQINGPQIIQTNRGEKDPLYELALFDLREQTEIEQTMLEKANEIQRSIDITKGQLVKAGLFQTSTGDHLLIVIHHLVIDGVSWRILLEDLAQVYKQALEQKELQLPKKTSSYQSWAKGLATYANQQPLLKEKDYWQKLEAYSISPLPKDQQTKRNLVKDTHILERELSKKETMHLLRVAGKAVRMETNEILLAALGLTLKKWTKEDRFLIGMEGHGREEILSEISVSRTIGWFTSMYPLALEIIDTDDCGEQISKVHETLQGVPNRGIGYGILKYLTANENKRELTFSKAPEICFNYLGQFDQEMDEVYSVSPVGTGQMLDPSSQRAHAIDITCMVMGGQFRLAIHYNQQEYREETISRVADDFIFYLQQLISYCSKLEPAREVTLKDDHTVKASAEVSPYPEAKADFEHLYQPFPLTDIQMAYFLGRNAEFELGGVSTHVYTEVETTIDIGRFNASLNKVISRHPMLRAIILPTGEQQILEHVPAYQIEVVDLRELDEAAQQDCIHAERNRMSHYVFPTDQWPLFEFKAYRLSENKHLLCMGRDLLIADAASMDIIGRDLMRYYENPDAELPHSSFTFRDYMMAYKALKQSEVYETDKQFWLQKVESFPQAPALPLRCNPNDIQLPTFQRKERIYSKKQWEKLKRISLEHGVTPSALFATIYAEILALWSNQSDIAINLTVFNRYPFHPDVEQIVGDFTSNLLLGIHFASQPTIWEKARYVQQVLIEALEHRHFEGVELIRELVKYHDWMHGKAVMPYVFTSVLTGEQQAGRPGLEQLGDLKTGITQTSQVYIDFQATLLADELWIFWDYVDELFEPELMETMFGHFSSMVDSLLQGNTPEPLQIGEEDRIQIAAFNHTQAEIPYTTLHALFAEQAQRVPDAAAVICQEQHLTYRELDARSNQVARYLQAQGMGRQDRVAVLASRQVGTIVNLLGVLKAGAAYVPVDPAYPEERRSYLLENSDCKLLLQPDLYEQEGLASYAPDEMTDNHNPDDVAYVIYTSGSTGRPKGVVITHGACANTIQDINRKYGVNETDRIIGLSSMCFDLSVYDIFGALGAGAALVMIQDQRDVFEVRQALEEHRITIWNSVPAIMEMLLDNIESSFLQEQVKVVLLSGDWIALHLPQKIKRHFTKAQVISLGGATEASIWSIYYPIPETLPAGMRSIPYGMPLANQQFYVLNQQLHHCPIGVQGELYIGGIGLAKEYLHDEEKTSAAFIPHPELGRLYRTGDYGVFHPEGFIEFLGRKDHQVKIRGYRIELGEIEGRLLAHDFVRQAVVVDQTDHRGKKYLCAYYSREEEEVTTEELRIYLLRELPEYMVPTYFIELDVIPLTPNGKVDRKALPQPDTKQELDARYVAPRTNIEEKLAQIWVEVLGLERVGVEDHFFELGGNSVLMVQIRTRISKELGVDVNLRDFLSHQTISKLAHLLNSGDVTRAVVYPVLTPDPANMHEPFPLTDVQMAYLMGREDHFEMGGVATHGYAELETQADMHALNEALNKVIAYQPMMRAIILPTGEQKILQHVPAYQIEILDLTHLDADAQQQWILQERERMSHYVFATDQWPLFEYKAFKLSADTHYLFISYDMLIADGASIQLMGKLLMKFYQQPDWQAPVLDSTYRDYILALEAFKKTNTYERDKAYWLDQLSTFPLAPILPMKQEPSSIDSPHFKRFEQTFARADWEQLKRKANEHNVTPSAVLCAAYAQVLSFWSNQSHFAINLTVFNRLPFHEDVNSLIGDFTSVILLEIDLRAHLTFWEKAVAIQERLLEALEHRHYDGIEMIRELSKYHQYGTRSVMPIVFTSILLGNKETGEVSWYELGEIQMGAGQTSQVYLDHQVFEDNGSLRLVWDYVDELFEPAIISTMFAQYTGILAAEIEGQQEFIFELSPSEQESIHSYNQTAEEIPYTTLHALFAEQAKRVSDAMAVICQEQHLTYRELDERSNQVARYLQAQGVGRQDRVAVLASRQVGTIVNLLGVLKAGAAYVPVDPAYPEERRSYLLENSDCKLLLQPDLYEQEGLASYAPDEMTDNHNPDDVAYVIYTSGSTGRPKGVVITHGACANTIQDINRKYGVNETDRIIGLSSMCFDLSVYDIFGALGAGAALVMIQDQRDVFEVRQALEEHRITIWNSVPAIMEMLLDNVDSSFVQEQVKVVLLSGDWIALHLPQKIKRHFTKAQVISLGGATEASIWSIYYPIPETLPAGMRSIPYGIPLANQQFYVLNQQLQHCPIGVQGELYIGGIGLAKEYLHDEEKTSAAFIPHPELGRLYRTGDYGVFHPEGFIEFLGRKDHQVKIRGYRIELGEIEGRLLAHDFVRQAVVVDQTDHRGKKYLCAYYSREEEEVTTEELRIYLLRELPEYMVPTYFIELDVIPLTPNGKVDRKALPQPDTKQEIESRYVAPRNAYEEKLSQIWAEVLGLERVGVEDHFFELGGNSVLMVQIRTRISKELGIDVNLRDFLSHQTISKLAHLINSGDVTRAVVYPVLTPDPANMHEPFPLTDVQMAYLMGREDHFEMGGVATHGYAELETQADMHALNEALNKVIAYQPMMRAIILPTGEQKILQHVPAYQIEILDLTHLDADAQQQWILQERERTSHYVFATDQWPLFEYKAFKLSADTHYLFISYDMLIADGASTQLMGKLLMKFYQQPDWQAPVLDSTYRDYILALDAFKKTNTYERDKSYWLDQLSTFPLAPILPMKQEPSSIDSPHFKRFEQTFSRADWEQLKRKANEHNVTPSAVLCAAYAQVLGYWSNQSHFAINLTVFNRLPFHEDVNSLIGDFTSVILLEIDLRAHLTFWEKAVAIQERLLEALEHRHYDGIEMIRELSKYHQYGTRSVMPIVFTSILLGNKESGEASWNELGEFQMGAGQTSQVYLDHQVFEDNGSLRLVWDYVDELFEPAIISTMFAQYTGILAAEIEGQQEFIFELSPSEQESIHSYNQPAEEIPYTTLHALFAEQAKRVPDAAAVICQEQHLTYHELDERSNQVARYLQAQGVGRQDRVAVLASRQVGTIVNLLGVLKAGAAYVPVDPAYPEERRSYLLENSDCKLLLQPDLYEQEGLASYAPDEMTDNHNPDDVAYVIYTSGSTGRPKGVVITHGACANTIQDINRKYEVNETDRIIGLSSMCFDLSVYDIFGALGAGAALVMIQDQRDVFEVRQALEEHRITIWNSVPAIMEMLLDNVDSSFLQEQVKVVLLSGDWIALHLPQKIKRHFTKAQVISLGGATEASIWSIYYPIPETLPAGMRSIPYGIPLANQQFYVLNQQLQHCPIGVQGELYIGGIGLAKEYLHDEEKTSAAFILHPERGRLYRTGDYGVFHPEGFIEFLGRKDHQVKIRGYRIELGEIEGRLLAHDFVRQAVVVDQTDHRGKKYLCAYYSREEEEVTAEELRIYLLRELPEYMVPTYFIELDVIPLTPNGKVDRKALPQPDTKQEIESRYVAPSNAYEEKLSQIWAEVLGLERVGVEDHFFELGGNSILMVQIRTRISKEMGLEINLRDFLSHQTISKLTQLLTESASTSTINYPEITADTAGLYEPFPLTDVQMAYLMGRHDHFEMGGISTHVYLELETKLDMQRFTQALQKVIARHPMLRAVILPSGEQQILRDVPAYQISITDLTHLDKDAQQHWIETERERMSHYIFPTDQWPLFEYKAYKLSADTHYLFIGYDMLITDGASFQFIHRELLELYHHPERQLPDIGITFRDYMLAYQAFKESPTYQDDKQYWLNKLEDFPSAPALPLRTSPELIVSPRFKRVTMQVQKEKYEQLKRKAREHSITPTTVLCTAFAKVLAFWSNQSHLALNCTIFNRYPFHEDVMHLIGDFTSVMLLDLSLSRGASFWEQAKAVQDVLMEALERRHYDGIQFIRDLARYHGLEGNRAVMPIVFTSMLLDTGYSGQPEQEQMGELKMAVSQTSQVFIDYQVLEADGGLTIAWDYVEELFEDSMISAMFAEYFVLLDRVLEGEDFYALSGKAEDQRFIAAYNDTDEAIPYTTLHALFVEQAMRVPEAIAVIFQDEAITYRELNERSNQVAHYLHEQGISRNDRVALLANRKIETIVNLLGIVKAGAAYVPIDPEYPEERVNYILDHSQCRGMLLPELYEKEGIAAYCTKELEENHNPDDVAYVIYTSGSTGRPKGVVITHGAAANTIQDINRKFTVNENDRIIGLSSMCFDLSVYDIFGALAAGATLVMVADQRDLAEVRRTVEEKSITIWNSVPAIMDLLMEEILGSNDEEQELKNQHTSSTPHRKNSSLRLALLSGDWISVKLPEKINKHFLDADVISLGGATEASIWSIYYPVDALVETNTSIPYGMPLANQKFYVLNEQLGYCPLGVQGELYIGGIGLAKEYLQDKVKTEEAFILHPQLGRLYRTGDYGILHAEGFIEFLGRKDAQVKIRGYRVELGEIENQLLQLPPVKEAVVLDQVDSKGKKYLCGYIVSEQSIDAVQIKTKLGEVLPSYMVPLHFMQVDVMPLSQNGKINRKAMPRPDVDSWITTVYVEPESELEKQLATIWSDLLGIEQIGVNDHLFTLGADSMSIIKFAARLSRELFFQMPIHQVFQTPTIREIAHFIANQNTSEPDYSTERMLLSTSAHGEKIIFCFPPVVALGVVYHRLAEILDNYSFYSFNFIESENRMEAYLSLIKQIQPQGPYTFLGISAGGNLAFEITKLLEKQGERVADLILLDSFYIQEINDERLTPEESHKYAQETVEYMLQAYPQLQGEGEYFKEQVGKKIESYYSYLDNLKNEGQVAANLYMIKSPSTQSTHEYVRGDINLWGSSTTGTYAAFDGYGDHEKMLDTGFVEQNATLINNILK